MILLLSVHVETSRIVHFHPNHISSPNVWTPLFKYNKICDPHPILLMASLQAFQDVFWSHYKVSALSTSVDVSDDVILEDVKFYGMFFFCYAAYFRAVKRISLDSFSKFPGCTKESVVCGGAFSVSCPYLIYYAAQLTNCFEISGFTEKILTNFSINPNKSFYYSVFHFPLHHDSA